MAGETLAGWRRATMRDAVEFFTSGNPFLKLEYSAVGVPVLSKGDVKPFGRIEHSEKRFVDKALVVKRGYRTTRPGDYPADNTRLNTGRRFSWTACHPVRSAILSQSRSKRYTFQP